ncbi:MAG: UTRA domain-containing protein, partial [Actinobacteria bacterium]|nr:UTRA domain-containing protein [Actinomycetota bacterium]
QIADQLRAQIVSEQLAPGQKLPSERELMETYDTARATIRQALRVLLAEGLVESRRGVGVFVRQRGPVRRLAADRFARRHREAGKAALTYEAESQGRTVRQELLELAEVPAPETVAVRLDIDEDKPVFVRRRRMFIDETPMQLADSYFPLEIAQGRIREENSGPGGVYARIEDAGHTLTRFTEELSFRMPTPDEARALHLGSGVPVIDLIRIAYAGDHPVEVFTAVMAGDKHIFQYEFPAT